MSIIYDLIILGAGPAGLSAGLYAGRSRLNTLIIEKSLDGGQAAITDEIENYPGSLANETGPSLVARMSAQVDKFGATRVSDEVIDVDFSNVIKKVICDKAEYLAKSIIIATGANPRLIGCPGEKDYKGKGISYCATCDGAFFEDLDIYVIGGGDSAIEEALYLTRFGKKVTIIHRRDELRAVKSLQEKVFNNEKVDFLWNSVVKEFKGEDGILNSMLIKNVKTGVITEITASEEDGVFGVFVFIGYIPNTKLFKGKVEFKDGYIIGNEDMATNIEGVFVAGDCRLKSLRQVVTATSDGAIAAIQADKYLSDLK